MAESLKAEIQDRNDAFMHAVRAGDAAALAALYTQDAWLLPPGADILRGRARIQEFWDGRLRGIAEITLTTVDVVALGADAACEVGTSEITLNDPRGKGAAGKYIVVWRREAGTWKVEADMFNGNT